MEAALPQLLEKCRERGWRALVRAAPRTRLVQLDALLWSYKPESFLPHALDDDPNPAAQPILLTAGSANANGAHAVFCIDAVDPGDVSGVARVCVVFDGADPEVLGKARALWAAMKADGLTPTYWKQTESGGWAKQGGETAKK